MNSHPKSPRHTAARVLCSSVLTIAVVGILAAVAAAAIVTGSNRPDVLLGTTQADTISALNGDDTVYGLGRDDRLRGGDGDDFLNGDGKGTCPRGATNPSYCALSNTETTGGSDYISGEDGDDRIEGGLGDDDIYAGYGADRIAGEAGNDVIFTSDGQVDTVDCGSGIDVVTTDRSDIVQNCELRLNLR
jgi:Ca2+-binding RTX toxin-like protein